MSTIVSAIVSSAKPKLDPGLAPQPDGGEDADFGALLDAAGAKMDLDSNHGFRGEELVPLREKCNLAEEEANSPETTGVVPELFRLADASTRLGGADGACNAGETEISDAAGTETRPDPAPPAADTSIFGLTLVYPEMLPAPDTTPNINGNRIEGEVPPFSTDLRDVKQVLSAPVELPAAEVTKTTGEQRDESQVPGQSNRADVSQAVPVSPGTSPFGPRVRLGLNGYEADAPLKRPAISKPLGNLMNSGIPVESKQREISGGTSGSLEAKIAQATTKTEPLPETVAPLRQTPEPTAGPAAIKGETTITDGNRTGAGSPIAAANQGPTGETVAVKPEGRRGAPERISQPQAQTAEVTVEPGKESDFTETVSGITGDKSNDASRSMADPAIARTKPALKENPDQILENFQTAPQSPEKEITDQVKEVNGNKESDRHVTKNELFSQIVEHGKIMVNNGHSEMELHLKPDHLGKLKLQISLENQIVTARFVAESEQVKEIIETSLTDLRRALQDNGIQAENLMVATGNSDAGTGNFQQSFFRQSGADSHRNFPRRQSFGSSPDMTETPWRETPVISQSRVDMIA
jgi:flagellar hook-length control protein FliK